MMPESHLRCGGEFHKKTDNTHNFLDPRGSVPINELSNLNVDNDEKIDNEKHENKEENMKFLVSKLEDLKGLPLGIPEYKDAYKVLYLKKKNNKTNLI